MSVIDQLYKLQASAHREGIAIKVVEVSSSIFEVILNEVGKNTDVDEYLLYTGYEPIKIIKED